MGNESSDARNRERQFEELFAAAVRKREERHPLAVPADLASTVMARVMHSAQPVSALAPIPWWKHALVIGGGILVAAAAALVSWWLAVTRVWPAIAERYASIDTAVASVGSLVDRLYGLYATMPVTDFVAVALLVLTIPLVFAFRLVAFDE